MLSQAPCDRKVVAALAIPAARAHGCRRLGLDTRVVCRAATERSVETLIRRLDERLRFGRNYAAGMRPHEAYCEEEIWLAERDARAIQPEAQMSGTRVNPVLPCSAARRFHPTTGLGPYFARNATRYSAKATSK